jgi:hypothetical protein
MAPCNGGSSLDNMLRVATAVQQSMTKIIAVQLEEEKTEKKQEL